MDASHVSNINFQLANLENHIWSMGKVLSRLQLHQKQIGYIDPNGHKPFSMSFYPLIHTSVWEYNSIVQRQNNRIQG